MSGGDVFFLLFAETVAKTRIHWCTDKSFAFGASIIDEIDGLSLHPTLIYTLFFNKKIITIIILLLLLEFVIINLTNVCYTIICFHGFDLTKIILM